MHLRNIIKDNISERNNKAFKDQYDGKNIRGNKLFF